MLFEGFASHYIQVPEGEIFCRIGGSGPPLLLLHGYPETHLMWHRTAPALASHYTVITADLRGYGASHVPASDASHAAYSKRAMAADMIGLMDALGYHRFYLAGHDRGGRVAHRLVRDNPGRVAALSVLDICPTLDMYETTDLAFATAYFHWFFLIQPSPMPENLIAADPEAWMESRLKRLAASNRFAEVEADYLAAFRRPERIHASCEDYRAAATIDLEHDRADRDQLVDIPIQVLWGEQGIIGRFYDPLAVWQGYTTAKVSGQELPSGHFIPEEAPAETIAALHGFFSASRL